MAIRIKDWHRFQHFKDRRPIWIKLYRDLLDDIEWYELDPLAAKVLVMLWLVASEAEGELPSIKELAFRLRLTEKQVESCVSKLSHYLEQDDINPISTGYQSDILEKRREETEKRREEKKEKFVPPSFEDVSQYCQERNSLVDPVAFHSHYTTNGWRVGKGGLPMKDWKAAIVTWERRA